MLYEKDCKINHNEHKKYCGVDLGLDNLMTCCFTDDKPLIINGKPLKSINQKYNKDRAKLQSKLQKNKHTSKRIQRIAQKRINKINDYLHKTSRVFVNYLVSKGITDVVIGYNKEWKQRINIGHVNNQKFVSIPFNTLLQMLSYKCQLEGINLITNEESYTSKCSFLDDEEICKHEEYVGKRVKRGLFRTANGKYINADVNGSLNILKKVIGKYDYDSIQVCSTPLVIKTIK